VPPEVPVVGLVRDLVHRPGRCSPGRTSHCCLVERGRGRRHVGALGAISDRPATAGSRSSSGRCSAAAPRHGLFHRQFLGFAGRLPAHRPAGRPGPAPGPGIWAFACAIRSEHLGLRTRLGVHGGSDIGQARTRPHSRFESHWRTSSSELLPPSELNEGVVAALASPGTRSGATSLPAVTVWAIGCLPACRRCSADSTRRIRYSISVRDLPSGAAQRFHLLCLLRTWLPVYVVAVY